MEVRIVLIFLCHQSDCKVLVKKTQTDNSQLDDIPFNFLIGGDGKVYEGRGFEYEGQHTSNIDATEYNSIGICIAFIGDHESTAPYENQLNILRAFIEYFISHEVINESYMIFSQDDLVYREVKASALKEAVSSFDHYHSREFKIRF
jgi:hypothetical protein